MPGKCVKIHTDAHLKIPQVRLRPSVIRHKPNGLPLQVRQQRELPEARNRDRIIGHIYDVLPDMKGVDMTGLVAYILQHLSPSTPQGGHTGCNGTRAYI